MSPPPVMLEPEVENVPDSEDYPGGGFIIRYKDTEGFLHDEKFSPNDYVAFSKKMSLCGDQGSVR